MDGHLGLDGKGNTMTPYYEKNGITIYNADCLDLLKHQPDNSIDSCVTDPPYGWQFMGKKWDYDIPPIKVWQELLRVLKPGAHILVACGTRTQHRMAINIEDAGFEIRDVISWIYGSGFPKSHNISKAIDKAAGVERKVIDTKEQTGAKFKLTQELIDNGGFNDPERETYDITVPTTDEAKEWDGWGTTLKPAQELFTLARKPLSEKTIAANVLRWGTGALNIDGCKISHNESIKFMSLQKDGNKVYKQSGRYKNTTELKENGRWPANIIHDGSDEVLGLFPDAVGWASQKHNAFNPYGGNAFNKTKTKRKGNFEGYNDSGSAARFFYTAKAGKKERNLGLDNLEPQRKAGAEFRPNHMEKALEGDTGNPYGRWDEIANNHPTVKPIALMRYLIRLITPPNGTVIDPYLGSGTTSMSAMFEDVNCIGGDIDDWYCEIAKHRTIFAINNPNYFDLTPSEKKRLKKNPRLKKRSLF